MNLTRTLASFIAMMLTLVGSIAFCAFCTGLQRAPGGTQWAAVAACVVLATLVFVVTLPRRA